MKKFYIPCLLIGLLSGTFFSYIDLSAQNAPKTTAGSAIAFAGTGISIPITVVDFTGIGSQTLRIEFNPNQLSYTGYSNKHPMIFTPPVEWVLNNNLHYIKLSNFWGFGLTLANGTKLIDLNFSCIEGDPVFFFNNNSDYCEYASTEGDTLNDLPTSSYYFHGHVHIIPQDREVQNVTVPFGQSACFDATETITTGGSGTYFHVLSGSDVTLIAGENIVMLPGTKIYAGAHLEAYISAGPYCGLSGGSLSIPSREPVEDTPPAKIAASSGTGVYPNPTDGIFTLKMQDGFSVSVCSVTIYNSTGQPVLTRTIDSSDSPLFSIANMPAGIYFIRIISAGNNEVVKVFKY